MTRVFVLTATAFGMFGIILAKHVRADEPPVAKVPFDAEQAKHFQEQWSKHLGTDGKLKWSWRNVTPPGEYQYDGDRYYTQSDDEPACHISWCDAVAFCNWLNRKEGKEYHLPTNLVKYEANPVLDIGKPGEWDAGGFGCTCVKKIGDTFFIWYGTDAWRIGVATSKDGIHWTSSAASRGTN